MNHSGDAAEQIVRMSLEGIEVAARITGSAAKETALFLIAAFKNNGNNLKLKGKARLTSMLKSGKALEIFSVKERDLAKFAQGAKEYGIVYCVLRNTKNTPDGLCDIMVKADDAPKISRVIERFKFATVDKAKIESEIIAEKAEKSAEPMTADEVPENSVGSEPETPDKNDTQKLVDDLMSQPEGKAEPDSPETAKAEPGKEVAKDTPSPNPDKAKTENSPLSEPTSESRSKSARGSLSKPSVKEEIREITARKKKEAETPKRDEPKTSDKGNSNRTTTHQQPQRGGKKSKKSKERS